jgi:hypothetical protein
MGFRSLGMMERDGVGVQAVDMVGEVVALFSVAPSASWRRVIR